MWLVELTLNYADGRIVRTMYGTRQLALEALERVHHPLNTWHIRVIA